MPAVLAWDVEDLGDGNMQFTGDREYVTLPPDFVLREVLEVDMSNAGVVAFTREWGPLTGLFGAPLLQSLPTTEQGTMGWLASEAEHLGHWSDFVVPIEAARLHLRTLQALASHLVAHRDGDRAAVLASWSSRGFNKPRHKRDAERWWLEHVNAALWPFRMHVLPRPGDTSGLALQLPQPNLYNVAVLQLVTYLSDETPVQRCANDRCRRLFTIQRTSGKRRRFENTSHAIGVRYCSHLCAKAQAERERRARRRNERNQP